MRRSKKELVQDEMDEMFPGTVSPPALDKTFLGATFVHSVQSEPILPHGAHGRWGDVTQEVPQEQMKL